MRMTSPEKTILENQMQIMGALSVIARNQGEIIVARQLSLQCSELSVILHAAKPWNDT